MSESYPAVALTAGGGLLSGVKLTKTAGRKSGFFGTRVRDRSATRSSGAALRQGARFPRILESGPAATVQPQRNAFATDETRGASVSSAWVDLVQRRLSCADAPDAVSDVARRLFGNRDAGQMRRDQHIVHRPERVIDASLGMRPADFPAVRLISYAGVTVVGSWLLWRAVRRQGVTPLDAPATREGALPYFAGMSPCPLTTIIMVVALANGMAALGLLVSLSMALGMIASVSLFALAVILCRHLLLDFLMRHAIHVERIARALEILGATAVTVIGLLLFSAQIL